MGLTHIGKIRTRLLGNSVVQAHNCSVTHAHLADLENPVYPVITLNDYDGGHSTWDRKTLDPGNMMIQIASQNDMEDCHDLYEAMIDALHLRRREMTESGVIQFHDIREIWHNSGLWDPLLEAWVLSSRFLIRVTVLQPDA